MIPTNHTKANHHRMALGWNPSSVCIVQLFCWVSFRMANLQRNHSKLMANLKQLKMISSWMCEYIFIYIYIDRHRHKHINIKMVESKPPSPPPVGLARNGGQYFVTKAPLCLSLPAA